MSTPHASDLLSPSEIASLRALCDTLIQPVPVDLIPRDHVDGTRQSRDALVAYFQDSGASDDVVDSAADAIVNSITPEASAQLRLVLRLLDSRLGAVLTRSATPFTAMTPHDREAVLLSWKGSMLEVLRRAFNGIKGVVLCSYYTKRE